MGYKQNTYHDDFKHISFEGQLNLESSSYEFIPSNFFTALLFQGIYFPSSLYGETEYETELGSYVWSCNQINFKPKETITINLNL